jgi:tRNA-guanine family transglycosylase
MPPVMHATDGCIVLLIQMTRLVVVLMEIGLPTFMSITSAYSLRPFGGEFCDCPCCRHYSAGYLHHLFKQGDYPVHALATLHNLRFMVLLTGRINRKYQHA